MIAKIVPKGIRLPKFILDELHIYDIVEMIIDKEKNEIILKPLKKVREGWDEAFKKMHENHDDRLLIDDSTDLTDWEW